MSSENVIPILSGITASADVTTKQKAKAFAAIFESAFVNLNEDEQFTLTQLVTLWSSRRAAAKQASFKLIRRREGNLT